MIYTVTFNPALDYVMQVENLELGKSHYTQHTVTIPGGKGMNVSILLQNMGVKNTAMGFLAGFVGDEILRMMQAQGVGCDFIRLPEGCSRINVKLRGQQETDVNCTGTPVPPQARQQLNEKLLQTVRPGDWVVISGSVAPGTDSGVYAEIAAQMAQRQVHCVVDATGELLLQTLPWHPFLIKPNHVELGDLFGVKINGAEQAARYAARLQRMGAQHVLVSLGGDGAVLLWGQQCLYLAPPKGEVQNTCGAGDSAVGGFLYGYLHGTSAFDPQQALRWAVCAGSASAFCPGIAGENAVRGLFPQTDAVQVLTVPEE